MQSSIRAARRVGVSCHVPGRAACPRCLYYRRYYTGAAISMSELAEADRRCPDLPTAEHPTAICRKTLPQRPKPGARPAAQWATRPRAHARIASARSAKPAVRPEVAGSRRPISMSRPPRLLPVPPPGCGTPLAYVTPGMAHHMSPNVHSATFSRLATYNTIYFNDHGSQM